MDYLGEGGLNDIRARIFKQAGQVSLDANGAATITFSPAITLDRQPYLNLTAVITSNQTPVIVNVVDGSFTVDGDGKYTGVDIKGARLRGMPGSIALTSDIAGFEVWQGGGIANTKIDWMVF